ncbi:uncharacterized protein LOC106150993 [Lingula anatina]|uniref:Uncharacterized protein LOC106150993 n=1 Tax=Lingula anatina TaxID=7574 RepID=A0A1S3H329_LINAN|nr:uncharacterized protein LOC106150993 [Lingula anatina]|eukprot:XP_013379539.1 uncharacterized protein LOC106150993 [Lingula anatina]
MARMPFTNFEDLNKAANFKFKEAMMNERSKRWSKAVQNYRSLLSLISLENFPPNYEPPDGYGMLLYELYYSLGWALQQVGEHTKAVKAYTKSINSVSIPKNGCLAGCHSNSCLMTPVHAKRAFAYAKSGDLKNALKDAEKTVVLDSRNPDVYCIRALVRNSRGEEVLALQDVIKALSLNSNHIASLIIRGTLQAPVILSDWPGSEAMSPNKDHEKAIKINPDSQNFLSVTSMEHPDVNRFYDRFLYSLNVPHTVNVINMMPKSREKSKEEPMPHGKGYESPMKFLHHQTEGAKSAATSTSFRCGSTTTYASRAAQRRKEYGNNIRRHLSETRPKTTSEILANLYKSLQQKHQQNRPITCNETRMPRQTSLDSDTLRSSISLDDVSTSASRQLKEVRLTSSSTSQASRDTLLTKPQSADGSIPRTKGSRNCQLGPSSGQHLRTLSASKPMTRSQSAGTRSSSSRNSSIAVFQPINVKEAPRMYYRPWMGDKLPVAEIPQRKPTPAFY